jgi:hypothetical protein
MPPIGFGWPKHRKWRRVLFVLAILFLPAAAFAGWWLSVRFSGPGVVNDALVGQWEAEILNEYGTPVSDSPGYHSLGQYDPPSLPQASIRSLTFRPGILFHPRGGTLVVWLMQQDGSWLCFESCWYADDVRF